MSYLKATALAGLLLLSGMLIEGQSQAATYKCVNAAGETSYAQSPCPEEDTVTIIGSNSTSESSKPQSCQLAEQFALDTATAMRDGSSSASTFNRHGGLSAMSGTAISIANYVYTFEQNYQTTTERIVGLVRTRCQSGSFGPTSCEQFPSDFVNARGGCYQSGERAGQPPPQTAFANEDLSRKQDNTASSNAIPPRALRQQNISATEQRKAQCQKSILQQLRTVEDQARDGLTATQQDSYREQRRGLKNQFDNC